MFRVIIAGGRDYNNYAELERKMDKLLSNIKDDNSFWIGIYDEDAKSYAGKFRFYFTSYGGMCGYEFNQFFNEKDIDCENDLRVQEMFLEKINMLIDSGIIALEDKL